MEREATGSAFLKAPPPRAARSLRPRLFGCFLFFASFFLVVGGSLAWAEPTVTARISPERIGPYEAAVLTVTVTGERSARPELPDVPGLNFAPAGTQSQFQMVNGQVSSSATHLFRVSADKPGTYTIPPIQVRAGGRTLATRPLALAVAAGSGLPSTRTAPAAGDREERKAEDRYAFLEMKPKKTDLFVGETMPMTVTAYFRQGMGVELNSLPTLSESAFVWDPATDKPQKDTVMLNGVPFIAVTWDTAVSAAKDGSFPVTASLDATVSVPEQSRRRHRSAFGGFFDDDFFDSFFTRAVPREVTLKTDPVTLTVRPLPVKGRPVDFSGAVGSFRLYADAAPKKVAAGDPVTLTAAITGRGNWDRVQAPEFVSDEGVRTYPPSAKFIPDDASGRSGTKEFERAVVLADDTTAVPAVRFSYFDTKKREYVTLTSKPVHVEVTGEAAAPVVAAKTRKAAPVPAVDAAEPLPGIALSMGPTVRGFTPPWKNPLIVGLFGAGTLFMLLALSLAAKKRLAEAGANRSASRSGKALKSELKAMDQAISASDAAGFFQALKRTAQTEAGSRLYLPPPMVTAQVLRQRAPECAEPVARALEAADAASYSGRPFTQQEMEQCKKEVLQALKAMEGAA